MAVLVAVGERALIEGQRWISVMIVSATLATRTHDLVADVGESLGRVGQATRVSRWLLSATLTS